MNIVEERLGAKSIEVSILRDITSTGRDALFE